MWATFIAENEYPGNSDAVKAAILHVDYDRMCSADPNYHKFLENMMKRDVENKKNKRKLERSREQLEKKRKTDMKKFRKQLDRVLELWKPKKKRKKQKFIYKI